MGILLDNYQSTNLSVTESSMLAKLDNRPELLTKNLTNLALDLHSSGTSIIRLCQKLGFSGFSEFKFAAKKLLSVARDPYPNSFLQEMETFFSLLATPSMTDKIENFAKEIIRSRNIYIAGVEASKSLSEYFSHKLNQLDHAAVQVSDDTLLDLLPNLVDRKSLVIYLSISGQTRRLINSAQKVSHTGASVFSLINATSSPLGRLSKLNIATDMPTQLYHNYDISPRVFQIAVIDLILEKIFHRMTGKHQ